MYTQGTVGQMTPFQEESSSWVRIRAALLVLVAARLNACARVVSIAGLRRGVLLCASGEFCQFPGRRARRMAVE